MPKLQEILDLMVLMQEDLQKTDNKNLLAKQEPLRAWGKLTDCIKKRETEKYESSFQYLENVIHRDCRVPPKRLHEERTEYAKGRMYLCELKPTGNAGKKHDTKTTGASPKPNARENRKIIIKQETQTSRVNHVPRSHTSNESYPEYDGKNFLLKQKCEETEKQLKEAREKLQKAETEMKQLKDKDRTDPLQKRYEDIERQLKDTQTQLRQSETDKEYWVERVSKITGDKLTRDNPDIADLSDPKRPHKLGEKYSQLYDNEWTDAMEKLTEPTGMSDRQAIDALVDILRKSHETCIKLADDQMKNLLKAAVILEPNTENDDMKMPIEVQTMLKDAQKQASLSSLETVQKHVRMELASLKADYGEIPLDELKSFVEKCTEICWGMVMQSPRMDFLFPEAGRGKCFNKDKFKEFMRSGDKLDFVVWPALVIQKHGGLLVKGSVQPIA